MNVLNAINNRKRPPSGNELINTKLERAELIRAKNDKVNLENLKTASEFLTYQSKLPKLLNNMFETQIHNAVDDGEDVERNKNLILM